MSAAEKIEGAVKRLSALETLASEDLTEVKRLAADIANQIAAALVNGDDPTSPERNLLRIMGLITLAYAGTASQTLNESKKIQDELSSALELLRN